MPALRFELREPSPDVREYVLRPPPRAAGMRQTIAVAMLFYVVIPLLAGLAAGLRGGALLAFVVAVGLMCWRIRSTAVVEESLTVIRGLGMQKSVVYLNGRRERLFIDHSSVSDVIINEGIRFQGVICYLAFIVTTHPDRMVLGFEHLYPSLDVLVPIYRGCRAFMLDEPEGVPEDGRSPRLTITSPLRRSGLLAPSK